MGYSMGLHRVRIELSLSETEVEEEEKQRFAKEKGNQAVHRV